MLEITVIRVMEPLYVLELTPLTAMQSPVA